ncbi:uncharacterized protein Triagg1_103 [Trichoderma aggressivum f. europaeum]|uniref:Uncharacterized protein n=1 Tax=Trichoderma aggressivum f. europaeum TaxID=173218 RepID=A0AAE1IKU2_9HYPO|nr:hypothetical protein Triagg1_103 [Trichoderma aggressivum f. europaeum]
MFSLRHLDGYQDEANVHSSQHSKSQLTAQGLYTPPPSTAASSFILQLCSLPPSSLIVPQSHNFGVCDPALLFIAMAAQTTDRLIDLTPPPSVTASPAVLNPISVHHGDHSDGAPSAAPEDQHIIGLSNVSPSRGFITAPEQSLEIEANNYNRSNQDKRHGNAHQRSYKKRAECLEIFQGIQNALWGQFHQIQSIVFDSKEVEQVLQELAEEELDIDLVRALRTLGNSLTGVRHILKGNIIMMEEAKANPSPSSSESGSSTPPSDERDVPNSRAESPDTEIDLLLDDGQLDAQFDDVSDFIDVDQLSENWEAEMPEEDVLFVDTPGGNAPFHLDLEYQSDVAEVYVTTPTTGLQSRRVMLTNLPPDATMSQITRGIQCHGGLLGIMMLKTAPILGNDTKTAMLEFVYHQAAAEFSHDASISPLLYKAKNGDVYSANAWLISSSSYGFGRIDKGLLDNGCARRFLLKGFPKECIWYFISTIGINNIVSADYDEANDGLTVEFATLFQANKADWLIFSGRFSDFYTINPEDGKFRRFLRDSTHESEVLSRIRPRQRESPISRRSGDDLEAQWNRYPYNDYLPPHLRRAAAEMGPTRIPLKTRLALQYDIDESEVDDYLYDLENHKDTEYRILGSSMTLTRRKYGWSMSAEDEAKLLLENTLHEPDWAEYWDEHFKACGEINRRKWEHYGMVAKHRREMAEEQGLREHTVPKCPKGCEMGCRDIKAVPAAAVVKKFLERSK